MLSDIFSPLPPFFHFSVDIKIPLFSYVFLRLPLFFTVLSVLMWLTLSDMIWPSTFFLKFFIQLSQGQVLRCILTLSPNFYIVCLVIKIQFLQTNFGASSLKSNTLFIFSVFMGSTFSDKIWPSPFFHHSLSNYHKVNVLRHILTLPPIF